MPREKQFRRALLLVLFAGCMGNVESDPPSQNEDRPTAAPTGVTESAAPPGMSPVSNSTLPPPQPDKCSAPPARIWRLTPDQYTNTVAALFPPAAGPGRPGDELVGTLTIRADTFTNEASGLQMSEPHVSQLFRTARKLATLVVSTRAQLTPCLATQLGDKTCVRTFLEQFGARAFRRPLRADELTALQAFHEKVAAVRPPEEALNQLATLIFMHPAFLYRTELGDETASPGMVVSLSPHERAAALSYFLVDGPPDAELTAAAARGALTTKAQLETQARRLLSSRQLARGLTKFIREHLELDRVLSAAKEAKVGNGWSAEDAAAETMRFVEDVLWNGDGKLATLFTSNQTFINGSLAFSVYGVASIPRTTKEWVKQTLPADQRSGLLTQSSLMAILAGETESNIVGRGRFVREAFLCQVLPEPPPDVNNTTPPPDGKRTQRERLVQHGADPRCAGCHALMDPVGFAFEAYDAIGRWRTTDAGKPVDTRGQVAAIDERTVEVANAVELGKVLAGSPEVHACLARKVFRYAHGRTETPADLCSLTAQIERFRAGGTILDLVVGLVSDDQFVTRKL